MCYVCCFLFSVRFDHCIKFSVFGSLLGYAMFFYINSASEFFLRFVKSRKAAPTDPEV